MMYGDDHRKAIGAFHLPAESLPRFVEVDAFRARWKAADLTDADLHVLQLTLAAHPAAGDVVSGTNGVRKVRFAAPGSGRGKSGSYRVLYLNIVEHEVVFLLSVLAKNERANLTKAERNEIARWVGELKADLDRARERPS